MKYKNKESDFCITCKKSLKHQNPKISIGEPTMLGWKEKDFCSKDCFLEYIIKTYKREIAKRWRG